MLNVDKLDCLQIGYVHVIILVSATQKLLKSFMFSATKLWYHATVMILCKYHLKRILALAPDDKRVAKHARESQKASFSSFNLDNSNHNNSINIIKSQQQ